MPKKGKKKASASVVRDKIKKLRAETGWSPSQLAGLLERKGQAKGKGSQYEREVCTELSLWWTNGQRDDVFWRAQASGARATQRAKAGRATAGQYGDVAATDPVGEPLIDMLTIEIKRGYSKHNMHDVLDKPENAKAQQYEEFLLQAIKGHTMAGSFAWLLITKRDRRDVWCWYPKHLETEYAKKYEPKQRPRPKVHLMISLPHTEDPGAVLHTRIIGTPLREFLDFFEPEKLKGLEDV